MGSRGGRHRGMPTNPIQHLCPYRFQECSYHIRSHGSATGSGGHPICCTWHKRACSGHYCDRIIATQDRISTHIANLTEMIFAHACFAMHCWPPTVHALPPPRPSKCRVSYRIFCWGWGSFSELHISPPPHLQKICTTTCKATVLILNLVFFFTGFI